jgi:photosynthetic reaction center cytochrome c subunit
MNKERIKQAIVCATICLALGFLITSWGPARASADLSSNIGEPQSAQEEKPAEQSFKNIQALKGLPASQLFSVMKFMAFSLGVKCDYCHVRTGNNWEWEKDDKQEKQSARKMIQMTADINKNNFGGRNQVTCTTCHRGQPHPISATAVSPDAFKPPQDSPAATKPAEAKPAEAVPTADQILDKYIQALGGKAAIEKVKTQVRKGTYTAHLLPESPIEIYQAAPNKYYSTLKTPKGVVTQGFNGTAGWVADDKQAREVGAARLAEWKSADDFNHKLNLKARYSRMAVGGKEKVGGRDAYVIRARTAEGNRAERLYFDAETGLLLRRVAFIDTMIGPYPEATDYEDYREVDGVKEPFTIRKNQLEGFEASTLKLTEVKHNVPVDDAKFNMPQAK